MGLDNIRRLGWCILKHTKLCQRKNKGNVLLLFFVSQEDPYLGFRKILYLCDKSRKYNILGPFLDL